MGVLVATVRVSHKGRIFEPGEALPNDADAERLLRLGAAREAGSEKPAPHRARRAKTVE